MKNKVIIILLVAVLILQVVGLAGSHAAQPKPKAAIRSTMMYRETPAKNIMVP